MIQSNPAIVQRLVVITATIILLIHSNSVTRCRADDWPMWRHDAGRTGATADNLPPDTSLRWVRRLPAITPAFHSPRLQFDAGYEPVAADGRVLIASSRNDSVTAFDTKTGKQQWVFRTNGPVRFAPAIWEESVCFGSDDGYVYCLELSTGTLQWKYRAVPSDRRLLGNRRLISVWPVRGGPVVADGNVYFAAGVWPFEGVFVYAMKISTGEVLWRNERLGYLFGQQPHNTQAIGGLAPQGYLVVNGDEIVVPCSTAYPARLNRHTGELIEFELPSPGRLPGGWFAALDAETSRAIRRGKLTFDDLVNQQQHEDKINRGKGDSGISRRIRAGSRILKFDDVAHDNRFNTDQRDVHSAIVSNGVMIASTTDGHVYCFGSQGSESREDVTRWDTLPTELTITSEATEEAKSLITAAGSRHGITIVAGLTDGMLTKALVKESDYHVIALDDNPDRIQKLREKLQAAGLYGTRAAVIECDLQNVSLPQYIGSLITTEIGSGPATPPDQLLQSLRPYGGLVAMPAPATSSTEWKRLAAKDTPGTFQTSEAHDRLLIRRVGAIPGTAEYRGNYAHCEDTLVRFPLGVLWFDDTLAHFKRSPQPKFIDGIMVSRPKDWHAERIKGNYKIDYPLMKPVLSDMYTGRVLDASEHTALRQTLPTTDGTEPQQSYYHAPHQKTALHPDPPVAGKRINPLTGQAETRAFPKTYGCDGGVDYGQFYTLRSGTAAFYDKTLESGTVFISGPRSGCTNSIIPSGGLLNVPYFYEGCTCSYPLPTALSLVAMPESHEQWASWGNDEVKPDSIQRIGLNFGAPGDRKTRAGTLWLDYPSVGGPSPQIRVETQPEHPKFLYRHTLWMQKSEGWPWVAASAVEGLTQLTLHDLKPGRYKVRLHFAELSNAGPGDRVQTVLLQGQPVIRNLDIRQQAKSAMTGIMREIDGVQADGSLRLNLNAVSGTSLISGLELIKAD